MNSTKLIFTLLFTLLQANAFAQGIPIWYKDHDANIQKINFTKFIKKNSKFSLLKSVDTLSTPEVVSILILDRNGNLSKELPLDSAAYSENKDLIISGKKKQGRIRLGVCDLNGEIIVPMEYLKIRSSSKLFACRNKDYLWALFDNKGKKLTDFLYTDMRFTSFGKVKIKNKNGAGILNEDGTLLIENTYGDINQVATDSFIVKEQDTWEELNVQNKLLSKWLADSINTFNDSLLFYFSEGRVFLKDTSGKTIGFESGYHKAEKFNDSIIKVYFDEYQGLISSSGKEILPINYYAIQQDNSGYITALSDEIRVLRYGDVVNKNKKRWSLFDSTGKKITTRQYKSIRPHQHGLIAIQNDNNLWGYIDVTNTIIVEPKYSYLSDYKNKYLLIKLPAAQNNDYKLIDKKEQLYFTGKEAQLYYLGIIRYRTCLDSIRNGEPETELFYGVPPNRYDSFTQAEYGYIRVKNGNYTGILDPYGREAVQAYQDTVYKASSDTFFLYKRANNIAGYADKYCNTSMYLTDKFEHIEPLQNGYSRFKKDGLYGFIDPYGNVQIAPKYTACAEFHNDMAAVYLKGKWGFIDKQENLSVQPYYKEVNYFRNEFAPVKNNSNKWLFIDKTGKALNSSVYENFYETSNNKYIVIKNKKWGITNLNGKEILAPKYEYLEDIGNNYIKVKKDGKYGVMDYQENIILYYQYDEIIYNPYSASFFAKTNGKSKKIIALSSKK